MKFFISLAGGILGILLIINSNLLDGQNIKITVSIGVAIYPTTVVDINMIVDKAHEALYQAKITGRNKVVLSS